LKKIKGCQVGINGFYCKETDSAALMTLTPPGHSMQGPNPEAVIESLKRARRLHGYSLALVGIILLIALLNLTEIEFPYAKGVKIKPDRFDLLALPMSIGLLSLVVTFMLDALKGARYLRDRQSAMYVGSFPWVLSRYSRVYKIQSFISRLIFSFHPIILIYFFIKWEVHIPLVPSKGYSTMVFIILSVLLLIFCIWIFYLSQRFQKPILFDRRTEEKRKNNIEELTIAVKEQTNAIKEMFDFFKSKDEDSETNESNGK
jgi:hypothetical protein